MPETINEEIVKNGKLEAEVHNLTKNVEKLFELVEKMQPKQLTTQAVLAIAVAAITILIALFGSVIYISNSSNAPVAAQNSQIINSLTSINSNIMQNANLIQLTNKEVSVISTKTKENEGTLQWIIFQENIPKQLTEAKKDLEFLKQRSHIHSSMTIP